MSYNRNMRIPKDIHIIWIGNDELCPRNCINTWVNMNPGWNVHLWENKQLTDISWHNDKHIDFLLEKIKNSHNERDIKLMYSSISDMMRYEILHAVGGFYVDADAFCIRPLEDWLFDSDFCIPSENEDAKPGLLANCFMASIPQNSLLVEVIRNINNIENIIEADPWEMTGPKLITDTIYSVKMTHNITIWPSHYFLPQHYSGLKYNGRGAVFSDHVWGSHNDYNQIKDSQHLTNGVKNGIFPVFNELIITPSGLRIINKNDMWIGKSLREEGVWRIDEFNLLREFISNGDTILECGSNIGSHTVDLCRLVGQEGKVYAFEPQRLVFQELVANISLNNIPNAFCYQKALGQVEASCTIPSIDYTKYNNFGGISLLEKYKNHPEITLIDKKEECVEVVTIDSLNLEKLNIIKLDTEGMEEDILRGAVKSIVKFQPVIYMESHNTINGEKSRKFVKGLGYKLYWHKVLGERNVLCLPAQCKIEVSLDEVMIY